METLQVEIRLVTEGCLMALVDLKDTYYSVPIIADHQEYLKFSWNGRLFKLCFSHWTFLLPHTLH